MEVEILTIALLGINSGVEIDVTSTISSSPKQWKLAKWWNGKLTCGILYFQDAFSLLAYADPWSSSVSDQLDPVGREPVCAPAPPPDGRQRPRLLRLCQYRPSSPTLNLIEILFFFQFNLYIIILSG